MYGELIGYSSNQSHNEPKKVINLKLTNKFRMHINLKLLQCITVNRFVCCLLTRVPLNSLMIDETVAQRLQNGDRNGHWEGRQPRNH